MQKKVITIIALVLLGVVIGYSINNNYVFDKIYIDVMKEPIGYKEVSIRMLNPPEVILTKECSQIKFNVTSDQALSILYAMKQTELQRPLTQDTLLDITNYYNISISQLKIDRKDNDIYKGLIILNQFGKILELDARPSDIIAISLRTKDKLYVKQELLDTANRIC